ncbi:MAG: glycine zipper 2TM domain-containing protein [Thiohalomonadales bacterium]
MLKINKLIKIITVVTISGTASIANAEHVIDDIQNNFFYATAKVINIEPIVKNIQVSIPERECWEEEVSRPVHARQNYRTGKVLFGGLVGGVVGNQFGHGRGKTAATLLGTIVGATIGHDIAREEKYINSRSIDVEQHCRITHTTLSEQKIDGYWVTYRYKGEIFTTRMDDEPAKHLKVRVQVNPVLN